MEWGVFFFKSRWAGKAAKVVFFVRDGLLEFRSFVSSFFRGGVLHRGLFFILLGRFYGSYSFFYIFPVLGSQYDYLVGRVLAHECGVLGVTGCELVTRLLGGSRQLVTCSRWLVARRRDVPLKLSTRI